MIKDLLRRTSLETAFNNLGRAVMCGKQQNLLDDYLYISSSIRPNLEFVINKINSLRNLDRGKAFTYMEQYKNFLRLAIHTKTYDVLVERQNDIIVPLLARYNGAVGAYAQSAREATNVASSDLKEVENEKE